MFCRHSKSIASKAQKSILPTSCSYKFASSALAAKIPRIFGLRDRYLQRQMEGDISTDALLSKLKRKEPVRITVTGGAGAIGYSLLYRLANGEMLGTDQPIILNVLELPQAMDSVKGVAMELEDCAFPLLTELNISDDPNAAFDGAEIALMVGSKPRGPGMERNDLLKENGVIFQKLGQTLNAVANKNCKVTVVGNPCNTNCLILANNAPDLKLSNFTAMTRLDHDRGVSILARKTGLPNTEINYLAIWGNHSSKLFPDLRFCRIHGVEAEELIGDMRFDRFWKNEFIPKVQQRGARIIDVRGASSAASAANACIAHTRDWLLGSPQPDWTSMAVVSGGEYGVEPGLVFSYPTWCKGGSYSIVSYPAPFKEFQQYQIEENIQELIMERDTVSAYLPN